MPYCDTVQSCQHLHTLLTFLLILFALGLVSSLFPRGFQTQILYEFLVHLAHSRGRDSLVGTATRYGLDGPGSNPIGGGEIFRTSPDRPWGPTSLLYNGYRVFPGGSGVPRGEVWGVQTPPSRNSEDIGGVLDRTSKKNRRLDFLL